MHRLRQLLPCIVWGELIGLSIKWWRWSSLGNYRCKPSMIEGGKHLMEERMAHIAYFRKSWSATNWLSFSIWSSNCRMFQSRTTGSEEIQVLPSISTYRPWWWSWCCRKISNRRDTNMHVECSSFSKGCILSWVWIS